MRLSIERLRTLVLLAGGVLLIAVISFLVVAHYRNRANPMDRPSALGINITQQADRVVYTQTHAGHTIFKIDAAKVVQISNGQATLSDVNIDLYSAEGSLVDHIVGSQFQYDQSNGIAKAIGPVEITMLKPTQAPVIAPNASTQSFVGDKPTKSSTSIAANESIRIRTSGIVFNQKSGIAATNDHLDFFFAQGKGSGDAATFDSQKGNMVIERNVQMSLHREKSDALLKASHAEFSRDTLLCKLTSAQMQQPNSNVEAANALIAFRKDGTVENLDASGGLVLTSTNGSVVHAPRGHIEFNSQNHPANGRLEDGVSFDEKRAEDNAQQKSTFDLHGTAPTALLAFDAAGDLKSAHLEQQVKVTSNEHQEKSGLQRDSKRTWDSPTADLNFQKSVDGRMNFASIHGAGGTIFKGFTQQINGTNKPQSTTSQLTADDLVANFTNQGILSTVTGSGHANIEETTANGRKQIGIGDKLEAFFLPKPSGTKQHALTNNLSDLDHALLNGHVILTQAPPSNAAAGTPTLHATAGRAEYEGTGEWLHLLLAPHVSNGGLEMSADRMDISRVSGDAFARGNVKASWNDPKNAAKSSAALPAMGTGIAHAVSNEADLHQTTGDAIFRSHARLWQDANSISAPIITLNRDRQTLVADSQNTGDVIAPVYAVFLSATGKSNSNPLQQLLRFHGDHLKYSSAERKAWLNANQKSGKVSADTGTGSVLADTMELVLLPAGVTNRGPANPDSNSQVDHFTAKGNVEMSSQGRTGTGAQLVYTGETSQYILSGPLSHLPVLRDPIRGTISGETLIFSSRDDSVSVSGTRTSTTTTVQQ